MTTPTFAPPVAPSVGTRKSVTARVLTAQFGDGYAQRAVDGLNAVTRKASLAWEALRPHDADDIEAFFEERSGARAFSYTLPGETNAHLWTCAEWTRSGVDFEITSLTAELTQVFTP
jgi:phage-related protein